VALRATIRDGVGSQLFSGCNDYGLVQVEVLDAAGQVVPYASDVVTLSVHGTATSYIDGTGNGDPAGVYNNKLPTHPAYHGLMLGVIATGNDAGTISVTASSPGLKSASVDLTVADGSSLNTAWCRNLPKL
jgi:beta-galactosidase